MRLRQGGNAFDICMDSQELKDYYGRLGIPQSATISDIHKAYWQQASRCHPDKGGSHEDMVQLVEAWNILSDPVKRARYDQMFKYRHDGWQSKKLNDDVLDARKRATGYSSQTWAEFEAIYQKAFYTFNQDFYGEDIEGEAAGPYSPLIGSHKQQKPVKGATKSKPPANAAYVYILKAFILLVAMLAAFQLYRNYSVNGRYVPLKQQGDGTMLILDTSTGAVYSMEKRYGTLSSPWKETVPPVSCQRPWPGSQACAKR